MADHPFKTAFLDSGAADDISLAIEAYAPLVAYAVSEITGRSLPRTRHIVLITGNAISFYKYDPTNVAAGDGVNVILDTDERPFVLVQRGDRYDIAFSTTGLLGAGEKLPAYAIPTPIVLPAGLPASLAFCIVPSSGSVVLTFEKSTDSGATWSDVCTVTFAAGSRTGAFTLAADAALTAGTLFRPKAPASSDATFAGPTITIVSTRSTS